MSPSPPTLPLYTFVLDACLAAMPHHHTARRHPCQRFFLTMPCSPPKCHFISRLTPRHAYFGLFNCHAMPRTLHMPYHSYKPLPHHAHAILSRHLVSSASQLDAIALSPVLSWERGRVRTSGSSSPTKRSRARSSSDSCSRSRSHSPPRHRRRRYASPERTPRSSNAQGKRNRHTTGGKSKGRNANPSFFQGGTAGRGTSACAVCLGHHEHEYAKCSASKLWNGGKVCVRRNEQGQLIFLDGLPVCFNFQTLAGCSDTSHPSRHICSGCGKSGHGAQQCAQAQKD